MRSPVLDNFLWLTHGVTTRQFAPPDAETFALIADVRRRLVPGCSDIFCCDQVHESNIESVGSFSERSGENLLEKRDCVARLRETDGLILTSHSVAVAIQTADCVPLLIADVRRRYVAAVHAGWRGSLERISEKAVGAMVRLGSDPADMVAWMGPTIGRESYEVGPELAERFRTAFPSHDGIVFDNCLDLVVLNAYQLHEAGVPAAQIHAANCCTKSNVGFCYSYRAEGNTTGRMVTYAMILPEARET